MITFLLPMFLIYSIFKGHPVHQVQTVTASTNLQQVSLNNNQPTSQHQKALNTQPVNALDSVNLRSPELALSASPTVTRQELQALPHCARDGKRAKSFLIIFMGHSGSSAILSELSQHSLVKVDDPEPVDHYEYETNTTLALQFTRDFFSKAIANGKTPGFKMRPVHIKNNPQAWANLMKEFDTRLVWQYRNNLVKQAVGEYSYKFYNDTSVVEGLRSEEEKKNRCKRGAGCRFKITDFDFFHRTLTDCLHSDMVIAKGVHEMAQGSSCVHALPYEKYLYNREQSMRDLRNFLGLSHEPSAPSRYKATSDNLCDVVENWQELCANFYGCHVWRHMFDDTRNDCKCEFSSGHVNFCDTSYRTS